MSAPGPSSSSETPFERAMEKLMAGLVHLQLTDAIEVGPLRISGGLADIYEGWMTIKDDKEGKKLHGGEQRVRVAVKRFRFHPGQTTQEEKTKIFGREAHIWSQLRRENILPLLGVILLDGLPCSVSEWMENGTMPTYLKNRPDSDITQIILGIARGLEYLHDSGVVYGYLKGDNVLINEDGRAVLSDFGTSRLWVHDITTTGAGSMFWASHWLAPEIIMQPSNDSIEQHFHTKASDVWAFGMVIYEALSNQFPYFDIPRGVIVVMKIVKGNTPTRPKYPGADVDNFNWLWDCCCLCWEFNPAGRPNMRTLLELLSMIGPVRFASETTSIGEQSAGETYNPYVDGPKILQSVLSEQGHRYVEIELGKIVGSGGCADVYIGTLRRVDDSSTRVAAKRFRVILGKEREFAKLFKRELGIWDRVQHDHVLPLLGVTSINGIPSIVSKWVENGTLIAYLETHPGSAILQLIREIASGVEYLHSCDVVHSDLKGDNVLISDDGHALLSDFGTSRRLLKNVTVEGTTTFKHTLRWSAPELLDPSSVDEPLEHIHHTKESDVWAFGMVVYEALSGKNPYCQYKNEVQIMLAIAKCDRPTKPDIVKAQKDHFNLLWRCCCDCWERKPSKRPSMAGVKLFLKAERPPNFWKRIFA